MNSVIEEIKKLTAANVPMFGICLGHQLIGSAFGGTTFKMKFGHRGGNQPIKDLTTGKVEITSHNHGFAVDAESLPADIEITHVNLNDNTVAGLQHKTLPIFSVQYHSTARATTGSICVTRRAGRKVATSAADARVTTTAVKTAASRGLT